LIDLLGHAFANEEDVYADKQEAANAAAEWSIRAAWEPKLKIRSLRSR